MREDQEEGEEEKEERKEDKKKEDIYVFLVVNRPLRRRCRYRRARRLRLYVLVLVVVIVVVVVVVNRLDATTRSSLSFRTRVRDVRAFRSYVSSSLSSSLFSRSTPREHVA